MEVHVWYLYILEMLVQMSWSWLWCRSTTQSSDSIEKEMKSGRESGWSARFLRVAVSYRSQRSHREREKKKVRALDSKRNVCKRSCFIFAFIFRSLMHASVLLLWPAHNASHMLIKTGCWLEQDAIQQGDRKLFSVGINHSFKRGKQ